ncbi:hypothetical protein [Roseateles sp. P5_E1]
MNQTPSNPASPGENARPVVERRTADRTHNEPWPDAMRDELRKVQFLAAVEVDEVGGDVWSDIFECFEGRHIRFI